jgi:hypothetical protein
MNGPKRALGASRLAGALSVAISVTVLGAIPAAAARPEVTTSTQYATIGERVAVTGTGWSPVGQTVQIQLCGRNAIGLSNDCDQTNQYTAAIRPGGVFYGSLVIKAPPTPCPCVFMVTAAGSFDGVTVPITIAGAPSAPLPPVTPPRRGPPLRLVPSVDAPMSVSSWFGGPKDVTLVLTVRNTSGIRLNAPALSVTVGRGSTPTGFVVGRQLAPLPAGGSRTLRIPVRIPPFTYGDYTIRSSVATGQGTVANNVSVDSYPWGLFAVAVCILALLLLWMVRRMAPGDARPGAEDGTLVDARDEPTAVP